MAERVITVPKTANGLRLSASGVRSFEPEAGSRRPVLLQNYLIAFLQPAQHFGLRAVRDSDVDGNFVLALFTFRVRHFHRGLLILVVKDCAFRNLQHILVLFQDDFRIGGHLSLEFAARILDRDAHFKRRDIIFLHAHRRNLGHFAVEGLVLERLHLDACPLAEIHLADVALVDLALHIYFAGIAKRHDQRGRRTQHQNRAHRVAHLYVARQHDAINRRNDVGIAELLFQLLQIRLILRDVGPGLRDLGLKHGDLCLRHVLLVQGQLVILLRVIQCRSGNDPILRHADGTVVGALQQRYIRTFRIDFGALEVGLRALQIGLRGFQRSARLLHLRLNLDLVELGQELSLLDAIAVVVYWDVENAISDLSGNQLDTSVSWTYSLIDNIAPTLTTIAPADGAVVSQLTQAQVSFSEPVSGVDAADLLINGLPATNVTGGSFGPYVFQFASPAPGTEVFSWASGHNIRDLSTASNLFGGAGWTVVLNPAVASAALTNVVINEFLTANINSNGLLDEDGLLNDWIEIFNRGTASVNLAGWSLTDSADQPGLWTFPATNLAAGQYLIVFASGEDRRVAGANLHTSFKLNSGGSYLGLYNSDFPPQAAHEYAPQYPEQRNDISYGLDNANNQRYFQLQTPGGPNSSSTLTGVVAAVHFSVKHGFFNQPFNLILTTETPGAIILYTTDGRLEKPGVSVVRIKLNG